MAKLVEILAQELKEWPANALEYITQDDDGRLNTNLHGRTPVFKDCGCWTGMSCKYLNHPNFEIYKLTEVAEDFETAIVTKEMWEAERSKGDEETMEKSIEFKVGDKVKIRKDSEYYCDDDDTNPKDTEGVVKSLHLSYDHPVRVNWSNGDYNYYRNVDLELVEKDGAGEGFIAVEGKENIPMRSIDVLTIRDRIYKIDEDLMALQKERDQLIRDLYNEGFSLIGKQ